MIKSIKILLIIVVLFLLNNLSVLAQNFEYRYEESSVISWNGINIIDARYLGTGNISFFLSPTFSGVINPSLISNKRSSSAGFTLAALSFDAFQYRGINEGVESSGKPLLDNYKNISSIAYAFKLNKIKANMGWYVSEILRFPSFTFKNKYSNTQYGYYKGIFSGNKNNFFLSFSFNLKKRLNIGLKFDYIYGQRNIILDVRSSYYYTINDKSVMVDKYTKNIETNNINQFIPTFGLSYNIKASLQLSLNFVYPLNGTVKRKISRVFANETQKINISNSYKASDSYYSPKRVSFGIKKDFYFKKTNEKSRTLTVALESETVFWSAYKYILFKQDMERDMNNSNTIAMGIEYGTHSRKKNMFYRVGFRLEPQPVKVIKTNLKVVSCGMGISLGKFSGDIGLAYWFGKCNEIKRNNIIVSTSFSYSLGGNNVN